MTTIIVNIVLYYYMCSGFTSGVNVLQTGIIIFGIHDLVVSPAACWR